MNRLTRRTYPRTSLSPSLEIEATAERFRREFAQIENPRLTRPYRAPFVGPKLA